MVVPFSYDRLHFCYYVLHVLVRRFPVEFSTEAAVELLLRVPDEEGFRFEENGVSDWDCFEEFSDLFGEGVVEKPENGYWG